MGDGGKGGYLQDAREMRSGEGALERFLDAVEGAGDFALGVCAAGVGALDPALL